MQAAFIMQSLSTIKKFGTDYLSLKPHTTGGPTLRASSWQLCLTLPPTPNQHLASRPGQTRLLQKGFLGPPGSYPAFLRWLEVGFNFYLSLRVRARLRKTWRPGKTAG
jgi:hypothetical protein